MKLKPIVRTLSVAFGGLALLAEPAFAQQQSSSLERVEVTGSRIKRAQDESPTAVQVLNRQDIERTGATTVNDLFISLPNFSSFNDEVNVTGAPSRSTLGFRNFSASDVLVLINGRRVAKNSVNGSAYDLSAIPISIVERVEILKDGAAAIYGSDAIAGVVNFITKKNFTGGEVAMTAGQSNYGDASEWRLQGAVGFGDLDKDRFNVIITADKFSRDLLGRIDRPESFRIAPGQYNNASPTGNFSITASPNAALVDGAFYPVNQCLNALVTDTLGTYCPYFFNQSINLIPGTERIGGMFSGKFKISDNHTAFLEVLSSRNETRNNFSAPPGTVRGIPVIAGDNLVAAGGAVVPVGSVVTMRIRFDQNGVRRFVTDNEFRQIAFGSEGRVAGWDYAANFSRSSSTTDELKTGFFNYQSYIRDVTATPRRFQPFTAPDVSLLGRFNVEGLVVSTYETQTFDFRASRELFKLAGGGAQLSAGLAFSREKLRFLPDANSQSGAVSVTGTPDLPVGGSRKVTTLFAELSLPITSTIEAQVAVRQDKYGSLIDETAALSDPTGATAPTAIGKIGSVTTPKLAVRWAPMKQLVVRGSYGKGFVAPDFEDLFRDNVESAEFVVDNPRCRALALDTCASTQYDSLNRSNLKLKAETSESLIFGAVFNPLPRTALTADFFQIKKSNIIGRSIQFLVDNPNYVLPDGRLASSVVGRVGGSATGAIESLDNPVLNLGGRKTSGLELGINHSMDLAGIRWTLQNDLYYVLSDKRQDAPGEVFKSYTGVIDIPKWRNKLSINGDVAGWGGGLTINTMGSFFDVSVVNALGNPDNLVVPTYTTVDFQGRWTPSFFKGASVTLGMRNMFNKRPTLTVEDQNAGFPASQSAVGRYTYLNVAYKFK